MIKSMSPKNKVIPFIPYYHVKTSQLHDVKVSNLKTAYGCNGYAVYDFIMNEILRTGGYSLPWCEDILCKVADYWELSLEDVREIVEYCFKVDLFNVELYTKYSVLTPTDIMQRHKDTGFLTLAVNS